MYEYFYSVTLVPHITGRSFPLCVATRVADRYPGGSGCFDRIRFFGWIHIRILIKVRIRIILIKLALKSNLYCNVYVNIYIVGPYVEDKS